MSGDVWTKTVDIVRVDIGVYTSSGHVWTRTVDIVRLHHVRGTFRVYHRVTIVVTWDRGCEHKANIHISVLCCT